MPLAEIEWAELIQQLIPSAERVRFTVTGTEATHLALRVVARIYREEQDYPLCRSLPRVA